MAVHKSTSKIPCRGKCGDKSAETHCVSCQTLHYLRYISELFYGTVNRFAVM